MKRARPPAKHTRPIQKVSNIGRNKSTTGQMRVGSIEQHSATQDERSVLHGETVISLEPTVSAWGRLDSSATGNQSRYKGGRDKLICDIVQKIFSCS